MIFINILIKKKIIMLLLDDGGNFNILIKNNQTPIAFAKEGTVTRLNLENCIATTDSQSGCFKFNNNSVFKREEVKDFEYQTSLKLKYERIEVPSTKITKSDSEGRIKIQAYFPQEPKKATDTTESA